jgi:hypothetical protein
MEGVHFISLTFFIGLLLGIIIQWLWNPAGLVGG